jgi:polyisoprenoid-binding protein YceI
MATWSIDTAHSNIGFKVKYLVISTVTGAFTRFDARIEENHEEFIDAKISFSAEVASITTNNLERDEHLKSNDFFAANTYPRMSFRSTAFTKVADGTYKLVGELSIKEMQKSIELEVEYGGKTTDAYGNTRVGFEISGKISRKEFGLLWDAVTETGGIIVGDEVRLFASVQMIKS